MSLNFDPQTLCDFVAVARQGNVSRAAERLHLSQPAVSLQLKGLAANTGLALNGPASAPLFVGQRRLLFGLAARPDGNGYHQIFARLPPDHAHRRLLAAN